MLTHVNSAFVRGLTQGRLSRRQLLRGAGGAVAGAYVGSALAACGLAGTRDTGAPADYNWSEFWNRQQVAGVLDWANWPLYIDTKQGQHPSIDEFTQKTGIQVNYKPVIQENASFFAQISPVLQAKQSIGYDLIVISDGWELTQMIKNRWLIPLDHARIPNFFRYAGPTALGPSFDPKNTYTATWQAGVTGIAYNRKQISRRIDSVRDLFDAEFAGKVGMMSDDTELGSVGMLALGIDPKTSTPADWRRAADLLQKQRDDGIVRQYYDQSYIKALEDGDTWISQAWSGDIFEASILRLPRARVCDPEGGRDALARQLHDPAARRTPGGRPRVGQLLLPPQGRGDDHRLGWLRLAGARREAADRARARRPGDGVEPARVPDPG